MVPHLLGGILLDGPEILLDLQRNGANGSLVVSGPVLLEL
jgi:hypothetical protein